ncbi:DUF1294 domain-containing protein [candidate division WWE3 bacterium]|nr:DUF1294 domain-containing protein [candidate division WWE3 bacterium]
MPKHVEQTSPEKKEYRYTYEEHKKRQYHERKYLTKSGLVQRYMIVALVLGTALLFILNQYTQIPVGYGFLVALNVTTFTLFGFDKSMASYDNAGRLPELFFHIISLLGGSLGIFIGAHVFRHKIRKWSFMSKEYAILFFQAMIIFILFRQSFFPSL